MDLLPLDGKNVSDGWHGVTSRLVLVEKTGIHTTDMNVDLLR